MNTDEKADILLQGDNIESEKYYTTNQLKMGLGTTRDALQSILI